MPKIENMFLNSDADVKFAFLKEDTIYVESLDNIFTHKSIIHTFNYIMEGLFLFGLYPERKFNIEMMKTGITIPELAWYQTFDDYLNSPNARIKILENFQKDKVFFKKKVISFIYNYISDEDESHMGRIDEFLNKTYSDRFKGMFEKMILPFGSNELNKFSGSLWNLNETDKETRLMNIKAKRLLGAENIGLNFLKSYFLNFKKWNKEQYGDTSSLSFDEIMQLKPRDSYFEYMVDDINRFENRNKEEDEEVVPAEFILNPDSSKGYDFKIYDSEAKYSVKTCSVGENEFFVTKPEMKLINENQLHIMQIWVDEDGKYVEHKTYHRDEVGNFFGFNEALYHSTPIMQKPKNISEESKNNEKKNQLDELILSKFEIDYDQLEKYDVGSLTGKPWKHIDNMFKSNVDSNKIEFEITSESKKMAKLNVLNSEYNFRSTGNTFFHIFAGLFLLGLVKDRRVDDGVMERGVLAPDLNKFNSLKEYLNSEVASKNILDNFKRDPIYMQKGILAAFFRENKNSNSNLKTHKCSEKLEDFLSKKYSNYYENLFKYYRTAFSNMVKTTIDNTDDLAVYDEEYKMPVSVQEVIDSLVEEGLTGSLKLSEHIFGAIDPSKYNDNIEIECIPNSSAYDLATNDFKMIFVEKEPNIKEFQISKAKQKTLEKSNALINMTVKTDGNSKPINFTLHSKDFFEFFMKIGDTSYWVRPEHLEKQK